MRGGCDMSIKQKLREIFKKRFGKTLAEEDFSTDLAIGITGIGLRHYDLLYLVKDIETEFDIKIDTESIETGRIRSVKGLVATMEDLVKEDKEKTKDKCVS
jgi:acyl carrier protein